jgi:hypothetical protein
MYKEYFQERFDKLILMDKTVFHKVIQIIQYSLLYVAVGTLIGSFISNLFPEFDPDKSDFDVLKEIILQFILLSIAIYYIRKVVKLFPSIVSIEKPSTKENLSFFSPNKTEINISLSTISAGEIILTLVLIATQRDLLRKIEHISNIIKDKITNINTKIKSTVSGKSNVENNESNEKNEIQEKNKEENNKINNVSQLENYTNTNNINNYNDRVLPVNTREEKTKINLNLNQNSDSFGQTQLQMNNQNYFSQNDQIGNNNFLDINSFNSKNQNINNRNFFEKDNTQVNNQNMFMQNNLQSNNSLQQENNSNNDYSSSISNLQMNNNLYSQEFKPLEAGGNFSFLSDNKQDINITKTLDYSSLLSDIYN